MLERSLSYWLVEDGDVRGIFCPELVHLYHASDGIRAQLKAVSANKSLAESATIIKNALTLLRHIKTPAGDQVPGLVTLSTCEFKPFMRKLYTAMLHCGLPLPPPIYQDELPYWVVLPKNRSSRKRSPTLSRDNFSLSLAQPNSKATWQQALDWFGFLTAAALIVGFTISAYFGLAELGLSTTVLLSMTAARLFTNYCDIYGGPQRRSRMIGAFFNERLSGLYASTRQYAWSRQLLYGMIGVILGAHAFISMRGGFMFAAILMKRYSLGTIIQNLAGLAYSAMLGYSSFGRMVSPTYKTICRLLNGVLGYLFNTTLNLDNVQASLKVQPEHLKAALRHAHESAQSTVSRVDALDLEVSPNNRLIQYRAAVSGLHDLGLGTPVRCSSHQAAPRP